MEVVTEPAFYYFMGICLTMSIVIGIALASASMLKD